MAIETAPQTRRTGDPPADRLLTLDEVAERLRLTSRAEVYRLFRSPAHPLPRVRVGMQRRVRESDLEAWLETSRVIG